MHEEATHKGNVWELKVYSSHFLIVLLPSETETKLLPIFQLKIVKKNMLFQSIIFQVHFDTKPPVVHVMRVWSHAARAARKGIWEQLRRDRERFKHRVGKLEPILNPIFDPLHRSKIYQERFLQNQ